MLQSNLSSELKATTYALQLSKPDEKALEPIRQTALVLEDMLQVVTGQLDQYPYEEQTRKRLAQEQKQMSDRRA